MEGAGERQDSVGKPGRGMGEGENLLWAPQPLLLPPGVDLVPRGSSRSTVPPPCRGHSQ